MLLAAVLGSYRPSVAADLDVKVAHEGPSIVIDATAVIDADARRAWQVLTEDSYESPVTAR